MIDPSQAKAILGNREWVVFSLMAKGYGTNEIATILCRSNQTISSQRAQVRMKLGAISDHEIVCYAWRNKLVE